MRYRGYWLQWADERFGDPGDPPSRWIREPSLVRDKDGRPPRGPSGSALVLCVCSGSVLLGDHLGVSRSREHDLLSVLFNYPRLFVYVQCVSSHSFSLFYSAINFDACSLLWFSCLYLRPPPLPFGRICFVVLVMRKRGESS